MIHDGFPFVFSQQRLPYKTSASTVSAPASFL
jgi:hypothetical protein